jgi:MipA family protein
MNEKNDPRLNSGPVACGTCLAAMLLGLAQLASAGEFPLWEVGVGAAVVDFPDYRGSDERSTYALPIPYVVYRGDALKVDRQRARGLLFSTTTTEVDLSLSGSVPVDSRDNNARQGMPDLDPTLELGPSLNTSLYRSAGETASLELRMPVRAVVASDFKHTSYQGVLFHPHVNLDLRGVFPGPGWNMGLLAGPLFADRRYHQYFYSVESQFAAPGRPAYEAGGGYSGLQFIGSVSRRFKDYWFGAFFKADSLHGAAFEDSPLVKQKTAYTGGLAVAYVFATSSRRVQAPE